MGTVWKAIADDSRRKLLLLLNEGDKTPKEMAKSFDFTLAALSTHLRVLRDAGLVSDRKEGMNRVYSLNREKMSEVAKYFDLFWTAKLSELKHHVEKLKQAGK